MKVLIVAHGHPELSRGGAEIASYRLFQALREEPGVEAFFLAATDERARQTAPPLSNFDGRPDEFLLYSGSVNRFLFSQRSGEAIAHFGGLLDRLKPDIVHFHHYMGLGLELIALTRRIRPETQILVTLHEFMAICHHYGQMVKPGGALCTAASPHQCAACFPDIAPDQFFLRQSFIQAHFAKVARFIAPSEFLRQRYVDWGLPSRLVAVVDNGLPPVAPVPPRPLGIGERRGVFGFFGQLHPFKGLLPLLSAFDTIQQLPGDATTGIRLIVNGAYLELNSPKSSTSTRCSPAPPGASDLTALTTIAICQG